MNLQSIYNIAEIFAFHGIKHAVISPGSRCAPLILAFSRHPSFETKIVPDERCAAYIALGMAQQSNRPVALICTSGTAALNYAPAIAEAFYQQVPLLILTADRPPEWLDQQDGQTIRQAGCYGKHVKESYLLPVDTSCPDDQWYFERLVSEAVNLANHTPKAPVHLNVPVREPFYPLAGASIEFNSTVKVIRNFQADLRLSVQHWERLISQIHRYKKILIVCGQNQIDDGLKYALSQLGQRCQFAIYGDILSNLHGVEQSRQAIDAALAYINESQKKTLCPDLLITFGQSVLSKHWKIFLRHFSINEHWHIQSVPVTADTFQSLTSVIEVEPEYFFAGLLQRIEKSVQADYRSNWAQLEEISRQVVQETINQTDSFAELPVMAQIMRQVDQACILHLGNSMPVRYANLFRLKNPGCKVFGNRGTSGIDGCVSTAVGYASLSRQLNIVIVGDMTALYDRNAFWNDLIAENFKLIVLNNQGGGIFTLINGPYQMPELDEFFVTKQPFNLENQAHEFNFNYFRSDSWPSLENALDAFFKAKGPCILEIFTKHAINRAVFEQYQQNLKKQIAKWE